MKDVHQTRFGANVSNSSIASAPPLASTYSYFFVRSQVASTRRAIALSSTTRTRSAEGDFSGAGECV